MTWERSSQSYFAFELLKMVLRADLHGAAFKYATSLRLAYEMNCFVQIKPRNRLRLLCTSKQLSKDFQNMF